MHRSFSEAGCSVTGGFHESAPDSHGRRRYGAALRLDGVRLYSARSYGAPSRGRVFRLEPCSSLPRGARADLPAAGADTGQIRQRAKHRRPGCLFDALSPALFVTINPALRAVLIDCNSVGADLLRCWGRSDARDVGYVTDVAYPRRRCGCLRAGASGGSAPSGRKRVRIPL